MPASDFNAGIHKLSGTGLGRRSNVGSRNRRRIFDKKGKTAANRRRISSAVVLQFFAMYYPATLFVTQFRPWHQATACLL